MGWHMGKSFIRTICERIFLVYLTHTNLGKFIQRYQSRYSEQDNHITDPNNYVTYNRRIGYFLWRLLFTVKKYFVISRYSYSIHSDVMSFVVPTRFDGQHPGSIHTYRYIYNILSILRLLSKTYFDSLWSHVVKFKVTPCTFQSYRKLCFYSWNLQRSLIK